MCPANIPAFTAWLSRYFLKGKMWIKLELSETLRKESYERYEWLPKYFTGVDLSAGVDLAAEVWV